MASTGDDERSTTRLGKAILLALAVQLVLTGFTGAVADTGDAPAAEGTMPARFSVPEVQKGDRVVYAVDTPPGADPPTVDGRPVEAVAVDWNNTPGWSLLPNGTYVWSLWAHVSVDLGPRSDEAGDAPGDARRGTLGADLGFNVGYRLPSWDVIGTTRYTTRADGVAVPAGDAAVTTAEHRWAFRNDLVDLSPPCGLHTAFHGEAANLSRPVAQHGDCPGNGDDLEAQAVEEVAGTRALRLQAGAGAGAVEVAYAPGLPVPVAWSGPLTSLVDAPGARGGIELRAAEVRQGDGPGPHPANETRPGDWPTPTAPWQESGPAERNLDRVALPLSEAYDILEDRSPEARSFLQDHPDAYVGDARMHKDRGPEGHPRTTWQIVLADGDDALERFVERRDPVDAPNSSLSAQPPGRVVTRDEASFDPPTPDAHYPDPADLPDELPVVDGSHFQASHAGYAPWEGEYPVRYGLDVSCADPACDGADAVVEVGVDPSDRRGSAGLAAPWARTVSSFVAGLDDDGRVLYFRGSGGQAMGPTVDDHAGSASQGPPAPGSGVDGGEWSFPSAETAAGVSLVAVLTGALYYVWPKLKLLGGALYSRIGRDPQEVLENDDRRRIHELVQDEPGIHFRELRRRLDTGAGLLEHHLEKLERAALVTEVREESYRGYFPPGSVDRQVMEAAPRLRSETARDLLRAVRAEPGASIRDLADGAGVSRSTAGYHVRRLASEGVLEKEEAGRGVAVRLTDLGERAVEDLAIDAS